jgi:bifunctional DNA-binding transcriptional regulator/antitoxin component of YhaV-PrlF toxin-antitoxin module|tara:strand:+ start:3547 stop:3708 length:162 start_codon:yes stop_codon:yes gene_type:complete
MKRYILEVEVDEHGECFITLPDEMLDETGWDVGTMLEWEEETDGSIVLHQINE